MIETSKQFQLAMKQPTKTIRMSVITNEPIPRVFKSSDVLVSAEISATGCFFGTAAKTLTMKLIGVDYDLIDVDITPTLETKIEGSDDEWQTCSYGKFRVTEQEADLENGIMIFKAYDVVAEANNIDYYEGDITYGCSIESLARQVAEKLHVDLGTDMTTLPNYDYIINEDLYAKISNTNYRNILAEIAGATATICRIHNNKLEFLKAPVGTTIETLTYANLLKVKMSPKYGPINSVVLSRTPQEDNIVAKNEESIIANGLTELKLANNEVLDDNREELASPILDAVDGFEFYPCEAITEGHGWYEVGDAITLTDGIHEWQTIITDIRLSFTGGIKETLKCKAPDTTQTDYSCAGGIKRTIYNTEIKVDKQNQEIKSIVSEVEELGNKSTENYTQIVQNITNITNTIQSTGGANLLYNSVGYATDNQTKRPTVWECSGNVTANTSPESLTYGAKSGNQINLGASSSIRQTVIAAAGGPLSLSMRVRKSISGTATISIFSDKNDIQNILLESEEECVWKEVSIPAFSPDSGEVTVTIEVDADVTFFAITDLMLVSGDHTMVWQQASGEILNANVLIDKDGIIVKNNVYSGDYVQITPLEFAGYSSITGVQEKVFSLNRDTTQVQKISVARQIAMPPIKIIPLTDNKRAGWAFVKGDK